MPKYFKTITLAIMFAALFVIFPTGSVFAEDGGTSIATPAPTETAVIEVTATEPVVEGTPLPTVDLIPTKVAGTEATPEPEVIATEVPAVEATQEPVLTETPAAEETPAAVGDSIVLADESGDPLPLTSTETSELLQGGDPYFMVGTQKYAWVFDPDGDPLVGSSWQSACPVGTVAGSTCFEATSTNAINAALSYINDHGLVPTDKKIYVEAGIYNESLYINGVNSIFYRQLTGLVGVNGAEVTNINGDVVVEGTIAGFNLSGFTIHGTVLIDSNIGALTLKDLNVENTNVMGEGIGVINQKGAVTITDVKSSGNVESGLYVDNSTTTVAYPVTITNSEFNNNDSDDDGTGFGAKIISKGAVTLNGVSASRNSGDGMLIDTSGAVTVRYGDFSSNVTVNRVYTENFGTGLAILNRGIAPVYIEYIQANTNGDRGIWIGTGGPVTVKNITGFGNGYQGLLIQDYLNDQYPTTVSVYDSEFSNNVFQGVFIRAKSNVTLSFVNANSNGADGVYIDTCLVNGAICRGTGAVTILNPHTDPMHFTNNGLSGIYDGLYIESAGAVTINGVSASENTGNGVYIKNNFAGKTGGVTINTLPATDIATLPSEFSYNGKFAMDILTNGVAAINGKSALPMLMIGNGSGGIRIDNSASPAVVGVTIKGVLLENNTGDGVRVMTKGAIAIDSTMVLNYGSFPSGDGFNLNNYLGTAGVTITGADVYQVNGYGFFISSRGAVSLKTVSTYRTGSRGIFINNWDAVTPLPVTLNDINVQQSHGNGIEILSKGLVTVNGASSSNNSGVHLPSTSVVINGAAYDNTWFDFYAESGDTVSICMQYSGEADIRLINAETGSELWSYSSSYETEVFDSGNITLLTSGQYFILMDWDENLEYDPSYILTYTYNGIVPYTTSAPAYTGIYVDNYSGTADVTMTGTSANPSPQVSNNSGTGITVISKGNIKLLDSTLTRNYQSGVFLSNQSAASAKNVTVGKLSISRSGETGLYIQSIGAVNMNDISSSRNGGSGIDVDNCYYDPAAKKCRGTGTVSLIGNRNYLNNNYAYGAAINTIGKVTLNNITAQNNSFGGLNIYGPAISDLAAVPGGGGVTLTSSGGFTNSFTNSYQGSGVLIYTFGPVSLQNMNVYNNAAHGIFIDNHTAAFNQGVILTNIDVSNSGDTGINVLSKGTVTLNGVRSFNNYYKNTLIEYGKTVEGIAYGYNSYYFDVPASQPLTVTFSSPDYYGYVYLFDPTGSQVASSNYYYYNNNSVQFDLGTVSGGSYRLLLSSWSGELYSFQVSVSDPVPGVDTSYVVPISGIVIDNSFGTGDVNLGKTLANGETTSESNSGSGLFVTTRGNTRIMDSIINSNKGYGANITSLGQAKTVALSNVLLQENGNYGIQITSLGSVIWSNVFLQENGLSDFGYGAMIINNGSNVPTPVTILNSQIIGSANDGLTIISKGNVSLTDVESSANQGYGLYVNTSGAIALTRVKALMNESSYGANLINAGYSGTTPPGVTITDSDFNYNTFGLEVSSKGTVTLTGVNTDDNYNRGQYLNLGGNISASLPGEYSNFYEKERGNFEGYYYTCGDTADYTVTITEADYDLAVNYMTQFSSSWSINLYDGNGNLITQSYTDGNGMPHYVLQPGDYSLRVTSYNGGSYQIGLNADPTVAMPGSNSGGANIHTEGNVIIGRSIARTKSDFSENSGTGLMITTSGSTAISDTMVNNNLNYGLLVNSPTLGKPVILTRLTAQGNGTQNLQISSNGPVTWNTGSSLYSDNGTIINNSMGNSPLQPVSISNVDFRYAEEGNGLTVITAGNVTLTNVSAYGNEQYAAFINNTVGANSWVAVTNSGFYGSGSSGGYDGLSILSNGAVTLTNTEAGMNGGSGINIITQGAVTLTYTRDTIIARNWGYGIFINTTKPIKLTTTRKLDVTGNVLTGIYLTNVSGGITSGVTVNAVLPGQILTTNQYNEYGIYIQSLGPVVLSNIYSGSNYDGGIRIGNPGVGTNPSSVTLTNISTEWNGNPGISSDGILVYASGPVSAYNIISVHNSSDGFMVISDKGTVNVKKAVLKWNGTYIPGGLGQGWGAYIDAKGNVVLDSIIANENCEQLYVNNQGTTGSVFLLGSLYKNEFNDSNHGAFLEINSGSGGINLTRFDALNNYGELDLNSEGRISISDATLRNNMNGIIATAANGAVFTRVISMNNGKFDTNQDGILDNIPTDGIYLTLTGGAVAFTDSTFIGNTGSGIEIYYNNTSYSQPYPLTLIRTLYFGNNSDAIGTDSNLYIHG